MPLSCRGMRRCVPGEKEGGGAARYANQVFAWQMAAQFVLLIIGLVFMGAVVRVLAPGFAGRPDQFALAVSLSRIAFPYLIFTVIAVQLSAMLNANRPFLGGGGWSIFLNLSMIATLVGSILVSQRRLCGGLGRLSGRHSATGLHRLGAARAKVFACICVGRAGRPR